jgi:hypothetical protein
MLRPHRSEFHERERIKSTLSAEAMSVLGAITDNLRCSKTDRAALFKHLAPLDDCPKAGKIGAKAKSDRGKP